MYPAKNILLDFKCLLDCVSEGLYMAWRRTPRILYVGISSRYSFFFNEKPFTDHSILEQG